MKLSKWCCLVGFLLVAEPGVSRAAQFDDFEYVINGTAVTVTKYTGAGGAVVIPDSIDGLPVTRIGNYAFVDRTDLTKPSWSSVGTNTLFNGTASFTDPESAARPARFYRLWEITPPRGEISVPRRPGPGVPDRRPRFPGCAGPSSVNQAVQRSGFLAGGVAAWANGNSRAAVAARKP